MPDADFPRRRFHGSGDFSARRCAEVSRLGAVGRLQEQWCNVGVSANGAMMIYIGASCGESPARSGEWSVTVDDFVRKLGYGCPYSQYGRVEEWSQATFWQAQRVQSNPDEWSLTVDPS